MNTPRRICAVTGSRADFGLLRWPLLALAREPQFDVFLVVTGQHLDPSESGAMLSEVAAAADEDGYDVRYLAPVMAADDPLGPGAAALALSRGAERFKQIFEEAKPDLVMILGDRYEQLAPAFVSLLYNIPIAHLFGGDVTVGAYDDAIRHAITKAAYFHFPTNELARERLIRMGESPERVFTIGSTGLDALRRIELVDRAKLLSEIGVSDSGALFAVTYHPETAGVAPDAIEATHRARTQALLGALGSIEDATIVFTGVNADTGRDVVAAEIEAFVETRPSTALVSSLGSRRYLSLLAASDAVIGNSSSGLYEAPSFGAPTVNIGDRQKGRLRAPSVIDCNEDQASIAAAIAAALERGRSKPDNPYGDGHSSERLVEILKRERWSAGATRKEFYDPQ